MGQRSALVSSCAVGALVVLLAPAQRAVAGGGTPQGRRRSRDSAVGVTTGA
jgi:hypothetical protein